MKPRVVITGMGITTPLGQGLEENWVNLCGGYPEDRLAGTAVNGSLIKLPFTDSLASRCSGLPPLGIDRAKQLAEQSCTEALSTAGLSSSFIDPERLGSTVSASKPLFDGDTPKAPEKLNEFIRDRFGVRGECRNVIAACATGVYSVAMAASWIEQGLCDVVLAGSVEPPPHPLIQAGFRQMGVTSSEGVTRPFDLHRSGFTFGEGAGILVLESEKHARDRGAAVQAALSGRALGSDSHSAYSFNSGGGKIASVIDQALRNAGLDTRKIRHVNAHGTATRHNDWIETQALLKSFGDQAKHLMISATKASTGHLLGASGAVELIFTVLALKNQFVPPTATLEEPDPDCPLDYTPRHGHTADFEHALSLSFGFGGPIGALLVSRS